MASKQEFKEWLRFSETIEALHALEDEIKNQNLFLRKVTKDQFEGCVGVLEGMEYSLMFLTELGDEEDVSGN